jgi:hypothetical protein
LYNIHEVSKETILSWFTIKQLKLKFYIGPLKININLPTQNVADVKFEGDIMLYFSDKDPELLTQKLLDIGLEQKQMLWNISLLEFIKMKLNDLIGKIVNVPFNIHFQGVYLKTTLDKLVPLRHVESSFNCILIEKDPIIQKASNFQSLAGEVQARSISVDIGSGESDDIVLGKNRKLSIFHNEKSGVITELETLATYDPSSDKPEIL